jgi:hypothetical protein
MTERPLLELSPKWILGDDGLQIGVSFDCPACADVERHAMSPASSVHSSHRILFLWGTTWTRTGREFHSLTITPSIDVTPDCSFHGSITDGVVRW